MRRIYAVTEHLGHKLSDGRPRTSEKASPSSRASSSGVQPGTSYLLQRVGPTGPNVARRTSLPAVRRPRRSVLRSRVGHFGHQLF